MRGVVNDIPTGNEFAGLDALDTAATEIQEEEVSAVAELEAD